MTTKRKSVNKKKVSGRSGRSWLKAFLISIIILLVVKAFLFEPYIVKSTSMGNTVFPGDILLIGKSNYGARIPITLLSMPFFGYSHYLDWIKLPVYRFPGLDSIKRFDLVLFNQPYEKEKPIDKRSIRISRILGLPGETIKIKQFINYVNDIDQDISNSLCYRYILETETESVFRELVDKYSLSDVSVMKGKSYVISTTNEKAKIIKQEEGVKKIIIQKNTMDEDELVFNPENRNWSLGNMGPIEIPAKGKTIQLNKSTVRFYFDIITQHEGNNLVISEREILLNGSGVSEYTFKDYYYFVLDDNRIDSNDSRYWGFLPESHIIGKSLIVLSPSGNNGIKSIFARIFRKTK